LSDGHDPCSDRSSALCAGCMGEQQAELVTSLCRTRDDHLTSIMSPGRSPWRSYQSSLLFSSCSMIWESFSRTLSDQITPLGIPLITASTFIVCAVYLAKMIMKYFSINLFQNISKQWFIVI